MRLQARRLKYLLAYRFGRVQQKILHLSRHCRYTNPFLPASNPQYRDSQVTDFAIRQTVCLQIRHSDNAGDNQRFLPYSDGLYQAVPEYGLQPSSMHDGFRLE